ncbi:methyl-accepting chemotaxis protein [Desulfobaculum xiamenense]|uniref:Methyl-accepting chemotaxis protein n=1 Tax=Desulfobaculum xiamenense TaxID=995050 RepID=A0A846QMQ6_9BACT|nr:methyl-accepting chemotaxis protein [Desulfobaculum xiamenense]NJB68467.1 methyl-accepting chemotaxis protein [Desulfobaculum xiamenense]
MTVKTKLLLIAGIAVGGLAVMFAIGAFGCSQIRAAMQLESLAREGESAMLQARRHEKNFLARNEAVYEEKTIAALDDVRVKLKRIAEVHPDSAEKVGGIVALIGDYEKAFRSMAGVQRDLGLTEKDGMRGELRAAIHSLESEIEGLGDASLMTELLQLRRHEKDFIIRGRQEYVAAFESELARFRTQINVAESVSEMDRADFAAYLDRYARAFGRYVDGRGESAAQQQVFTDVARKVEPAVLEMADMASARQKRVFVGVISAAVPATLGIAVALLVCVVLVARSISRPLDRLQQCSRDVAGGDYEAVGREAFSGEFESLRHDIEMMVAGIRRAMNEAHAKSDEAAEQARAANEAMEEARENERHVRSLLEKIKEVSAQAAEISEGLSAAASQLAAEVEQTSRGAEIQQRRVTETATAMEQMTSTILEVARNSSSAAHTADQSKHDALEGRKRVVDTVQDVAQVQTSTEELSAVMNDLSEKADSIGEVMTVIADIADQTNLLALNAAIEAARAGDAGRGFAVVADEVRKLAEKTMAATQEVGRAIAGVQQSVQSTIAKRRVAEEALAATVMHAREAGDMLGSIVSSVEQTAQMAQSIATAAEEQSAASEQINSSVEEISQVSAETARGTEESALAIRGIASRASQLQGLIRELRAAG